MNKWAFLGSLTFIAGAIGHFIIVDLSVWILEAGYVHWFPTSMLEQMRATTVNWGAWGQQNFMRIFSGFSLWLVPSLIAIAISNMLVFKHVAPGHPLRRKILILNLGISVTFLLISSLCFIYPPVIGGILAVLFFTIALIKEKKIKV